LKKAGNTDAVGHGLLDCRSPGLADENSEKADSFLQHITNEEVWVPSRWWHEISNVIVSARHRKRITDNDASGLMQLYGTLPVHTDIAHGSELLERTHRLAMSCNLSAYDAAYLELAERKQAGLATLDAGLGNAAESCGVKLFAMSRS